MNYKYFHTVHMVNKRFLQQCHVIEFYFNKKQDSLGKYIIGQLCKYVLFETIVYTTYKYFFPIKILNKYFDLLVGN